MDEKEYFLKTANRFGWGPKAAKINPHRAKLIERHLLGERILDLGCGSGIWVDHFSRRGYQVTGVDWVEEFISHAKETYRGEFILADVRRLPFPDDSFDTVLMFSLLEHLDQEEEVLREVRRVGKRLILIVPQATPQALIRRGLVFKHHLDRTHRRVYTQDGIRRLMAENDFGVKEIIEMERLPVISILPELFVAPKIIRRIVTRLFFWLFKERDYYLELMVVADRR